MTDVLLTTREAAELLRVERSTLQRLVRSGGLSAIRVSPTRTLYRLADLEDWVTDHEQHPTAGRVDLRPVAADHKSRGAALLTAAEVCEHLQVASKGEITPIRASSHRTLYRRADIDRWLAKPQQRLVALEAHEALELLALAQAEDERPLCPGCGRRRVNRGGSGLCTYCEQQQDLQLTHKREWWTKTGSARRAQTKKEAASG